MELMSIFFKLLLTVSAPVHGGFYKDDEKILADLHQDYNGYFEALGHPCNYKDFTEKMVPFWNDFFEMQKSHTTKHYDLVFNLKYPDIYVNFDDDMGEVEKTLYKYEFPHDSNNPSVIPIHVTKEAQRKLEMSRCFTGGPMECDQKTEKCVCMNNPRWLETKLMHDVSGEEIVGQDPTPGAGQACGVELHKRCYRQTYWLGYIYFDCLKHNFCNEYLNICVDPIPPKYPITTK